jgi:hypothetical protein
LPVDPQAGEQAGPGDVERGKPAARLCASTLKTSCSAADTPEPETETMNATCLDAAAAIWVIQPPWLCPHRPISSGLISGRVRR